MSSTPTDTPYWDAIYMSAFMHVIGILSLLPYPFSLFETSMLVLFPGAAFAVFSISTLKFCCVFVWCAGIFDDRHFVLNGRGPYTPQQIKKIFVALGLLALYLVLTAPHMANVFMRETFGALILKGLRHSTRQDYWDI